MYLESSFHNGIVKTDLVRGALIGIFNCRYHGISGAYVEMILFHIGLRLEMIIVYMRGPLHAEGIK